MLSSKAIVGATAEWVVVGWCYPGQQTVLSFIQQVHPAVNCFNFHFRKSASFTLIPVLPRLQFCTSRYSESFFIHSVTAN